MLDGSHYGVQATPHQKKMLRLWIESAAAYPGTYAALGSGMIGNYAENNQVNTGADWPATKAAAAVIQERCVGCHDKPARLLPRNLADERGVSFWQPSLDDPRLLTSRHIVFNLSRPEKSLMLLAPLAKDAGGWGLCRKVGSTGDPPVPVGDLAERESVTPNAGGKASLHGNSLAVPLGESPSGTGRLPVLPAANLGVFRATSDPGYQAILAMIVAGKEFLDRDSTRFDMPGFVPRTDWVREMKRYDVLPEMCAARGSDGRLHHRTGLLEKALAPAKSGISLTTETEAFARQRVTVLRQWQLR